jgi:hypothetical protein
MLKEHLEQLFDFIAQYIPAETIMEAKKEYQKTTGEIYEDDKSYNARMALFLEWYLLDNYKYGTNINILESIIEDNREAWTHSQLEVFKDIANSVQALFEIKKVRDDSVLVLDLFKENKYRVDEEDSKLIFRKNDIFQGRVVSHNGKCYFTGYFCFHPSMSHRYIRGEAKKLFLCQRSWSKDLVCLEKELSNKEKESLKKIKHINKIKNKIERADIGLNKDRLTKEFIELEESNRQHEISTNKTVKNIDELKNKTIKVKGRKMISELINKLAYMKLKWERSRQIEISDIYKN